MAQNDRINEFMELFTRSEPRISALVFSLLANWADADDVKQEINAVLWKKFDEFESGSNFLAWAYAIARIEVMRYRKSRGRDRLQFTDQFMDVVCKQTFHESDLLEARRRSLADCVEQLSEADRKLIRMRYAEGATVDSVAEQVGRSVDAVYKAVMHIRRALHRCVQLATGAEGW